MLISVRKMTNAEFERFYQWSIDNHVKELLEENQMTIEEAIRETKEEVAAMLPDGLNTKDNYLMMIEERDSKEPVGFIWTLHEETEGKKQSFVCDFFIYESKRRKGYATATLAEVEKEAVEAGCQESVLFVADNNYAAIKLYKKCNYQFLRQMDYGKYMIKQL